MRTDNYSYDNANQVFAPTCELLLCMGVTNPALAKRFKSPGALDDDDYTPENDKKTKHLPRKGRRLKSWVRNVTVGGMYKFTLAQTSQFSLDLQYQVDRGQDISPTPATNAAAALAAVEGLAFDFDEGDDGEGVVRGDVTDLRRVDGSKVEDVELVVLNGALSVYGAAGTSATLARGIDYEIDFINGEIVWLRAINDDVITPTITSNPIDANSPLLMVNGKPFGKDTQPAICRVRHYDDESRSILLRRHDDFLGFVTTTTGQKNDGQNPSTIGIEIEIGWHTGNLQYAADLSDPIAV